MQRLKEKLHSGIIILDLFLLLKGQSSLVKGSIINYFQWGWMAIPAVSFVVTPLVLEFAFPIQSNVNGVGMAKTLLSHLPLQQLGLVHVQIHQVLAVHIDIVFMRLGVFRD